MSNQEPPVVPEEYGGKWVAWSPDGMRIIGSGDTLEDAQARARQTGELQPILEWVPPPDELLVGGTR